MIRNTMLSKRICQECGKEIYFPCFDRYAWKKYNGSRLMYFCSYTCMRKGEAKVAEERSKKQKEWRKKRLERKAMQA